MTTQNFIVAYHIKVQVFISAKLFIQLLKNKFAQEIQQFLLINKIFLTKYLFLNKQK
ncbi:hypothetical protein [Mesomycoplasma ovipneumoniae]